MVKKIFAFSIVVCMLFLNVACDTLDILNATKSKLDPQNPITITLWHYYFDEKEQIFNDFVDEFNSTVGAEKGIIVQPINKGRISDLEKAVTNSASGAVNSDPMPNIFSTYIDKAIELSNMNKIVNLDDYYTKEEKAKFVQHFVDSGTYDKRFMVLPIAKSCEVFYLNKTKWDEFKAVSNFTDKDLETWEGISKISNEYYKTYNAGENRYKQAFFGYESLENFIIVAMKEQGIDIIDGENKMVNLDKPALKKFFNIYFKNMVEGKFYMSGKFRSDNVKIGELASYVGSIAGAVYFPKSVYINEEESPIQMMVLKPPTFEGMKRTEFIQGAGMSVAQASDAEIEASIEFLKWFTKDSNNLEFAVKTAYLPARVGAYEGDAFNKALNKFKTKDEQWKNLVDAYAVIKDAVYEGNTYYAPPFDKSFKVREILGKTLQGCVEDAMLTKSGTGKIDYDKQFEIWLKKLKKELDKNEIRYE